MWTGQGFDIEPEQGNLYSWKWKKPFGDEYTFYPGKNVSAISGDKHMQKVP